MRTSRADFSLRFNMRACMFIRYFRVARLILLHIVRKRNFIFRTVDPEYASVAGMFGAASIVTGIFSGIGFSYLMPLIVSHHALHFGAPYWWPSYVN